MNIILPNLY